MTKQPGPEAPGSSATALSHGEVSLTLFQVAISVRDAELLLTSQVALPSDTANPAMKRMVSDMTKYEPGASVEELSIIGWGAVQLFAMAAERAGSTPADAINSALSSLASPINLGVAGAFGKPASTPYVKGFPGMFNPTVANGTLEDGKITPIGKGFVNPFTTLAAMKGQ